MFKEVWRKICYRSKFKPYQAAWAEDSYHRIVKETEAQSSETCVSLKLNNRFSLYEKVMESLKNNPDLEFCSLKNFTKITPDKKTILGLRHDVDIDITMGTQCARYLARHGIPSTFFILHTAHYYGYFKDDIFYRNPAVKNILISFIVAGCEIGLHIDPLSIYINHGINGAQALKTELEWMRGVGAKVAGTAAHNSAPLYGAENFEIFKGKSFQNRTRLKYENLKIPLQVLDERGLRLEYESNFAESRKNPDKKLLEYYFNLPLENAILNKEWMKIYLNDNPCFERGFDYTIWLNGMDSWIISGHQNNKHLFLWNVKTDELLKFFSDEFFKGKKVILVMHPCYFTKDRQASHDSF